MWSSGKYSIYLHHDYFDIKDLSRDDVSMALKSLLGLGAVALTERGTLFYSCLTLNLRFVFGLASSTT